MTHDEMREHIRVIPPGKVRTHSDIYGDACAVVGRVQNDKPEAWHRVVYTNGTVKNELQRRMLENEGVKFNQNGKIDDFDSFRI